MIRFSAFLVAVALGLLVAGVVTSKLMLVYVAIGVSGVALLALCVGTLIKRSELFGQSRSAGPELARPAPAAMHVPPAQPEPQVAPWEVPVSAAPAWPVPVPPVPVPPVPAQPAPSRAGYLPAEPPPAQPVKTQPVKAQPADAAATAWGSGFPFPPERPPERQADVQRRPAAFTPRPPAGPPSPPAPGVPAPTPGAWEWRADAPATQPLREIRRPEPSAPAAPQPAESPQAGHSQPPAQDLLPTVRLEPAAPPTPDQPAVPDQPPAREEPPAQDEQPAPEDVTSQDQPKDQPQDEYPPEAQQTQQLPVAASTATEPAPAQPDPVPAQPDAATPGTGPVTPEAVPAPVDVEREVTVVPGVPRYHNPHCLLIRFMGQDDLDKMTLDAARKVGCTPCRACLPDQPEAAPESGPA